MNLNTQIDNTTSLTSSNTEINQHEIEDRVRLFVDADYYRASYDDINSIDIEPMNHFVKFGWRENRRPNRWYTDNLVPTSLIEKNPTIPPYLLFIIYLPGIDVVKYEKLCGSSGYVDLGHTNCWTCELMKEAFDGHYYRNKYPDLDKSIDGLSHFCELGWKEQRNPCANFNTKYYLACNEDVRNAEINPFMHYLNKGINEGRKPQLELIVNHQLLRTLKTITELSQEYRQIVPKLKLIAQSELFITLLAKCSESKGLCLSLSHDDYMNHTGGVQKFIRDESHYAQEAGYVYLHLCPAIADISLNHNGSAITFLINCTLNDTFIGTFTVRELTETLSSLLIKQPLALQVAVIHSAMGWNIESMISVISNLFAYQFFYVHDYFALCTEYRLLRNNIVPCDAPELKSMSCNICAHSNGRVKQVEAFTQLFEKLKPTLLYPSNCAKALFGAGLHGIKLAEVVVPHIKVIKKSVTKKHEPRKRDRIRVAYCGAPVGHKGFYHFEQIVEKSQTQVGLEFFHFGNEDTQLSGVEFVKTVLKDGKSQMIKKIEDQEIDIVFIGSTWRETFNFVAYEAVQAGAAIITLESAGNVCDFVAEYKIGRVVKTWEEAAKLLQNSDLTKKLMVWQAAASNLSFVPNQSFLTKGVL